MLSKGPNSHKADGNEHGGNGNNAAEDKLNGGVTLDFEGRPNHRSEQSVHGDIWTPNTKEERAMETPDRRYVRKMRSSILPAPKNTEPRIPAM